jgi:dsRNA-specific ribonuclease
LEKTIGYRFNHPLLLWQALLDPENNELRKNSLSAKLAFLGDAALKLTLTDILLQQDIDTPLKILNKTRQMLERNNFFNNNN